ncbi:hypothetical protein [Planomicrobium sp. CPCC 101079]|uniref:hypothetical protein n=1 Tax=Planomicrobium sp. CPCC 101079 TaxID=2599618 RepID=UPI0011B890CF|nr:hypothetical protein [Planomicrobium sp. CPCC 101079]TWT09301.1 hypothetical protein FQV28_06615 [Planomicrobium sp. CPCC 101079]
MMKGLDEMMQTSSLKTVAETISLLLDAEIERTDGLWQIRKQRLAKNTKNTFCMMDFSLEVKSFEENGTAVNKASVYLLPEELPRFTSALWQHPISFPTTFSQKQTADHHLYCLHLETKELPQDFVERLADALQTILE